MLVLVQNCLTVVECSLPIVCVTSVVLVEPYGQKNNIITIFLWFGDKSMPLKGEVKALLNLLTLSE